MVPDKNAIIIVPNTIYIRKAGFPGTRLETTEGRLLLINPDRIV
jgi:hypothetical protein